MNRIELYPQKLLLGATLLGCLLIAGCARKSSEPSQDSLQQEIPAASAPAPPAPSMDLLEPEPTAIATKDCPSAQRYRDNICELAEKICGTGADSVGTAAEGTYCRDAKSQCDAAKQRYQAACE